MIDKIFIIHYEPLIDRKLFLDSIIPKLKLDYEFVFMNDYNDNQIMNNLDFYYLYDPKIYPRKLNKNEICVTVKHIEVYQKILKQGLKNCLILEDDAIFDEDIINQIEKTDNEIKEFDFVFLSTCCNLRSNNITIGKKIYPSLTTRCVNGYLVNYKCLHNIINNFIKFSYPIDWHLNQIQKDCNLKFGWHEPPLITQGSETIYKSNLR